MSLRLATTTILSLTLSLSALALDRAELLPSGTPYARVSNVGEFVAKMENSSIGKLWKDPRFQDFLGHPEEDLFLKLMFGGGDSEEISELLVEQNRAKTGELVMGFDMENEHTLLIVGMTDEEFARDQAIDQQIVEISEEPFRILKHDFQGVELIEHIAAPDTKHAHSSWQTHVANTFVMGESREWVERCVIRLKNEAATEPSGNPVLNLHMPLNQLFELVAAEEFDDEQKALFDALGLMGLGKATARVELLDDRMLIDNRIAVSDLDRGLFALLDTEPAELPTTTFIPADAAAIEVGRIDLAGLWRELPVIVAAVAPDAMAQFDMTMGMVQQQLGINLEQDVFAHLGTKYLSFGVVEGETAQSIIALELEDGAAFKKGVETALAAPTIAPMLGQVVDITDFLDHQIYEPKGLPPESRFAFTITADHLVYGQPNAVRQMIRAINRENAANNAFEQADLVRAIRQHVPASAFGFGAIDWKKNMDVVLRQLQQQNLLEKAGVSLDDDFPLDLDFDQLPPSDHIASFFNISVTYMEKSANDLHQKIILKY